jgi:ABC-type histidine transport system ATPase subunit
MVFQHFNLWAHMTVLANIIEAPVHVLGLPRDEAVARAQIPAWWAWRARGRLPEPHERRPAAARGDCPALAVEPEDAVRRAHQRSTPSWSARCCG